MRLLLGVPKYKIYIQERRMYATICVVGQGWGMANGDIAGQSRLHLRRVLQLLRDGERALSVARIRNLIC